MIYLQGSQQSKIHQSVLISRVGLKKQHDTYLESKNRFLNDNTIIRAPAPTISDEKDSIIFECIDVDLWVIAKLFLIGYRYDGSKMKREDDNTLSLDMDSVLLF